MSQNYNQPSKVTIQSMAVEWFVQLCTDRDSLWPNYTGGGHCPPFHQRPVIAGLTYCICFYPWFTDCWFICAPETHQNSNLEHILPVISSDSKIGLKIHVVFLKSFDRMKLYYLILFFCKSPYLSYGAITLK